MGWRLFLLMTASSCSFAGQRGLVSHLLDLAGGEIPTVMAIDDDTAGQGQNKKSREYEKHERTEHDKSPVAHGTSCIFGETFLTIT